MFISQSLREILVQYKAGTLGIQTNSYVIKNTVKSFTGNFVGAKLRGLWVFCLFERM